MDIIKSQPLVHPEVLLIIVPLIETAFLILLIKQISSRIDRYIKMTIKHLVGIFLIWQSYAFNNGKPDFGAGKTILFIYLNTRQWAFDMG